MFKEFVSHEYAPDGIYIAQLVRTFGVPTRREGGAVRIELKLRDLDKSVFCTFRFGETLRTFMKAFEFTDIMQVQNCINYGVNLTGPWFKIKLQTKTLDNISYQIVRLLDVAKHTTNICEHCGQNLSK